MKYKTAHNEMIFSFMSDLGLYRAYSPVPARHTEDFIRAGVQAEFSGKAAEAAYHSEYHRTATAHFMNEGCWEESEPDKAVRNSVKGTISGKSRESGKPVFFSIDDTVCCRRKPSSQAKAPAESTAFHHSHLLGKQVCGHQVTAAAFSCDDIALNYDVHLYGKTQSKIDCMAEPAKSLPAMPSKAYMLCGSWFTCRKIIDAYEAQGCFCIGALKTNRIIYPPGIRINISQYAQNYIEINDADLVTVNGRDYCVCRYECALNDTANAAVLMSRPADAFRNPKALKAFICTDTSLDTQTIPEYHTERRCTEIFFKQEKSTPGFDKYQIRKIKGIKRFRLLLPPVHLLCVSGTCSPVPFSQGRETVRKPIQKDTLRFIYHSAQNGVSLSVLYDCLTA